MRRFEVNDSVYVIGSEVVAIIDSGVICDETGPVPVAKVIGSWTRQVGFVPTCPEGEDLREEVEAAAETFLAARASFAAGKAAFLVACGPLGTE